MFSAYFDLNYDALRLSVANDPGNPLDFPIDFGSNYESTPSGSADIPGVIEEVGASQTNSSMGLGMDSEILFSLTVTANAPGVASIIADPADFTPLHDVLTFSPRSAVGIEQIEFGSTSISVLTAAGFTNTANRFDVNTDGYVSPFDALSLINDIGRSGSRPLASNGQGEGGALDLYRPGRQRRQLPSQLPTSWRSSTTSTALPAAKARARARAVDAGVSSSDASLASGGLSRAADSETDSQQPADVDLLSSPVNQPLRRVAVEPIVDNTLALDAILADLDDDLVADVDDIWNRQSRR